MDQQLLQSQFPRIIMQPKQHISSQKSPKISFMPKLQCIFLIAYPFNFSDKAPPTFHPFPLPQSQTQTAFFCMPKPKVASPVCWRKAFLIGLQLITKKDYMGPCTSIPQKKASRLLPLIFQEQPTKDMPNGNIEHEFEFQLSKVAIFSPLNKDLRLFFKVEGALDLAFSKENMAVCELSPDNAGEQCAHKMYQIQWNQTNKIQFTTTHNQLRMQFLSVSLEYCNKTIEILRINLNLIIHGPFHHNIELPFQKDHLRLMFDAKISHIFETSFEVKQFSLKTYELPNLPEAHFTIRDSIDEMILVNSYPSYNIALPHSILLLTQETGASYFQEERPNINRLKKNTSFVSLEDNQLEKKLVWKKICPNDVMPSLTADISTQEIVHHSLQFIVWGSSENDAKASYLFEAKLPLWKILEKKLQKGQMQISSQKGLCSIQIEERTVKITEKLYSHHNIVGTCDIVLQMKNQKIIEQLKYCSRTEDGIVNLAPHSLNKDIKSNSKMLQELWKDINQIEERLNSNNTFAIYEKLMVVNNKILLSKSQVYNDINRTESLVNNQNIYLTIIEKMIPFIQSNETPALNSLAWNIIHNLFEKNQLNLENLYLKGTYATKEVKSLLAKKKEVCKKYHRILNSLIKYALKSYSGINSISEGYIKFLGICFFRVKSFRDHFFLALEESLKDEEIEKRLMDFQKEVEPKTSFQDNFLKMKTDWTQLFYKEFQNDVDFMKSEEELRSCLRNKKWFMEIGFKDELFYTFCTVFFDKLKKMNLGGAQKWKYLDGYSQITTLILGQIKNKNPVDYSSGLIKASISMLSNEYLINLLLPLICEKTSLHDFLNVQIVLDLVHEYLNCLTKNKTLPLSSTFNQNYFFTLIRTIVGGEHFYSINRILIIIYDYFNLLSQHGRYQISMFLLGNSFFKLYYHWSKDIRYTFYNILLIRIQYLKHRKSNEIQNKFNKALDLIAIIERLYENRTKCVPTTEQTLLKKLRMKVYQRRKNSRDITTLCNKNEFQLDRLERLWQQENDGFDYRIKTTTDLENISEERTYFDNFMSEEHLGSVTMTPEKKRRTYSQNIELIEQNQQSRRTSSKEDSDNQESFTIKRTFSSCYPTQSDGTYDTKGRRKRKPSVFLGSVSENAKHYTSVITNSLHYFSELTNEELKNVLRAKVQFKDVSDEIRKYIAEYSTYPERNFSEANRKQLRA